MMQLLNGSGNGRRKKSKTGEDGSYQTGLAMETEEERRARLEKMEATTGSGWPWRQRKKDE